MELLNKEYDFDNLSDIERDVYESFSSNEIIDLEEGVFEVKITYKKKEQ